jgi:hypothetical protein
MMTHPDSFDYNLDEYYSDDSEDEIYFEMDEYDAEYNPIDKINGKYYLGSVEMFRYPHLFLLQSISVQLFFKYPIHRVAQYLFGNQYDLSKDMKNVRVIKLNVLQDDEYQDIAMYSYIDKTHWIRLVQRHWKKVIAERKNILLRKRQFRNLRNREIISGFGAVHLPTLNGMLHKYRNIQFKTKNK